MAASALIPARRISLFLTALPALPALCFSSCSTTNSLFGMVKLSRTSFGFFGLSASMATTPGLAAALADAGRVRPASPACLDAGLDRGLAPAFETAVFRATGLRTAAADLLVFLAVAIDRTLIGSETV